MIASSDPKTKAIRRTSKTHPKSVVQLFGVYCTAILDIPYEDPNKGPLRSSSLSWDVRMERRTDSRQGSAPNLPCINPKPLPKEPKFILKDPQILGGSKGGPEKGPLQ